MTLADYKFQGVPKPFKHQIETTQFILDNPRCFVFNDIGTGKTWSAVWAADYLMQAGEVRNVLIVAPLSTLEIVWQRTFFHLDAGIDCQVLKGSPEKRKKLLGRSVGLSGHKVSIINPDALHIIADDPAIDDYDMVLVDESAMFRNSKSRRVKALNQICSKMKRVVMMSGSPVPEAPTDIWATARIVCPDRVPKYFGQFRDKVMRKINMFKYVALPDADKTIAEMLKGFVIRYRRDECIDLPPSQSAEFECEPTKEQKDLITQVRKHAVAEVEDGNITAANEAVVISKILQIASGAVKYKNDDGESSVLDVDCKTKFDALEEIIDASTQPVIVFAPYTAAVRNLSMWCAEKKIPYRVVIGATSAPDRLAAFDSLQSGFLKVLIAHPQAMAHGITLTNSNVVVWWCPVYSHEIYEQANGRVVRPGQIRSTFFIHLTASALERRVLSKLNTKSELQGTLLEYLQRSEN